MQLPDKPNPQVESRNRNSLHKHSVVTVVVKNKSEPLYNTVNNFTASCSVLKGPCPWLRPLGPVALLRCCDQSSDPCPASGPSGSLLRDDLWQLWQVTITRHRRHTRKA